MGIVYMIRPKKYQENDSVYIGSTTYDLKHRYSGHKSSYGNWLSGQTNGYISSYRIFMMYGFDNCECITLETTKSDDKYNLRIRERYYVRKYNCVNSRCP